MDLKFLFLAETASKNAAAAWTDARKTWSSNAKTAAKTAKCQFQWTAKTAASD
jgi:hypothetical protein